MIIDGDDQQGADDETLDLTDAIDDADNDGAGAGAGDQADGEGKKPDDEDGEETVVSFADDQPEDEADAGNKTVRQMREALREKDRELKELRSKVSPAPKVERKPEPTFEDCDYDEAVFKKAYDEWKDTETKADAEENAAKEQQQAVEQSWQKAAERYATRKTELGLDFTDAEEALDRALGPQLSPVLLKAAKDPAAVVLALGRSPARLAELQKIKDPIELAAEVARLEGGVRVEKRKRTPAIDRPAGGNGSTTLASGDAVLKRLEEKANKPGGDRSELVAYKKKHGLL